MGTYTHIQSDYETVMLRLNRGLDEFELRFGSKDDDLTVSADVILDFEDAQRILASAIDSLTLGGMHQDINFAAVGWAISMLCEAEVLSRLTVLVQLGDMDKALPIGLAIEELCRLQRVLEADGVLKIERSQSEQQEWRIGYALLALLMLGTGLTDTEDLIRPIQRHTRP